jgi:hypothetical protein
VSAEDDLRAFIAGINGFARWGHADKVRMFAWLQHFLRNKPRFGARDVNWCYKALSYEPGNTSRSLRDMEGKDLLKDTNGYYCEGKFLAKYNDKYGTHDVTLNVRQQIKDLINYVPDIAEKDFMKEAEICLRHDAGRATIIMVWNVAFYHLCQFILKHHLAAFNARYPIRLPGKHKNASIKTIVNYDDFAVDLTERDVIEICSSANIITADVYRILVEKLGKRNSAAHPSTIHVKQVQAEAFIDELVRNVVLVLPV